MPIEFEIRPPGATLIDKIDSSLPYRTSYHDNRFQFVILSSELLAAGLLPGDKIIAVKFRCGSTIPGKDIVNFRIRMQNTDLTTSSSWVTAGWTTVFGPSTVSRSSIQANSWQQYDFVAPFVWDGRNLLLDTSKDDTTYIVGGSMYVYDGLSGRACGTYHDSSYAWPYDNASAPSLSYILQTVLVVDRVLTATLEPQAAGLSASIPAPHVVHNAAAITSPALKAQVELRRPNIYYPTPTSVFVQGQIGYSLSFMLPTFFGYAHVAASAAAVSATMERASARASTTVIAMRMSAQAEPRPPQVYARVLPFRDIRTKSKPIVYDQNGKRLAVLEHAYDIVLTQEINGEDALMFALPATDKKAFYVVPENRVQIEDAEYIIRRVEETHDENGKRMSVYCEAPWYDLMVADPLTISEWTNVTPDVPMHDILSGTGWTPGVVEITAYRTLKVDQATTNRLAALRKVTEVWGGELEFDTAARRVHLRKEIARRPGIVIAFRKNMRAMQRITDTSNLITRLYAYGKNGLTISSVNNGVPYVENFQHTTAVRVGVWKDTRFVDPYALKDRAEEILAQLSRPSVSYIIKAVDLSSLSGFEHESFRLGDYVIVYDDELGEKIETRIVRWQYHVDEPWRTEIELSTRVPRLSDYMYDAEEETRALVEDTKDLAYDTYYRLQELEKQLGDSVSVRRGVSIAFINNVQLSYFMDNHKVMIPFTSSTQSCWAVLHITYLYAFDLVSEFDHIPPQRIFVTVYDSEGRQVENQAFFVALARIQSTERVAVAASGSATIYLELNGYFNPGTIELDVPTYTYYGGGSVEDKCASFYANIVWEGTLELERYGTTYIGNCGTAA